jgi:hypothetical protein
MASTGSGFTQRGTASVLTPYEGDAVNSPSGGLIVSRVAGANNGQLGYVLRRMDVQREGGLSVELPEIARYCITGGKPGFSFDERYMTIHHYVSPTSDADARELGFTGASDPGYAMYAARGAVQRLPRRAGHGPHHPRHPHGPRAVRALPALPRRRLAVLPRAHRGQPPRARGRQRRPPRRGVDAVTSSRAVVTLCLTALGLTSACGAPPDAPQVCAGVATASSAATVAERAVLGVGSPYPADATLSARAEALRTSQRARREAAWQVIARVVAPVPVPAATAAAGATVPRFRTWYDREDFTRLFQSLYEGLGPEGRAANARFSETALDEAFGFDARRVHTLDSWQGDRWSRYLAALDRSPALGGLAGARRVGMSPDTVRHLLNSYPEVLRCLEGTRPVAVSDGHPPRPPNAFSASPSPSPAAPPIVRGPSTSPRARRWRPTSKGPRPRARRCG